MSAEPRVAGDVASATVLVTVPPDVAFGVFVNEIDLWWRQGVRYRIGGRRAGQLHFEAGVGGRLLETYETAAGPRTFESGRITAWEPPSRLEFEWRGVNFAPGESTMVTVEFTPTRSGTSVTVRHRGFAALRPDHPVRHGKPAPEFIRTMGLWWGDLLTSLREHAASRQGR